MNTNRLYNLDYLRGLAAFSIMIYHYMSWTCGEFGASTFLGRVGLYGVSVFYVLSGLTLFYVYEARMQPSGSDITAFFRKRFFRIYPLLWFATIATILLSKEFNPQKLFLNLTGLFGLVQWDNYFAVGAWSIGNELVFYLFFIAFIFLRNWSKAAFIGFASLLFAVFLLFAFRIVDAGRTLGDEWKDYVNPLNQVFLFLGGFLIGWLFKRVTIDQRLNVLLFLIAMSLFTFYPVSGDRIQLVTGMNRVLFVACCFVVCFNFYKLNIKFPAFLDKPLVFLGEASYSVYLLHPIVFTLGGYTFSLAARYVYNVPDNIRLVLLVAATLVLSYFVYQYLERYFMKLGNRKKTEVRTMNFANPAP